MPPHQDEEAWTQRTIAQLVIIIIRTANLYGTFCTICQALFSASPVSSFIQSPNNLENQVLVIPTPQMWELKPREVKQPAQGPIAGRWKSQIQTQCCSGQPYKAGLTPVSVFQVRKLKPRDVKKAAGRLCRVQRIEKEEMEGMWV